MSRFIQRIPAGTAGEAIHRAVAQIGATGIACERPAGIEGMTLRLGFGGHPTNELILAILAGLADPDQAETAQEDAWRLPKLIGLVSSMDGTQKDVLCALARTDLRPTLYEAISTLIQAEQLHEYFEREPHAELKPAWQHYEIRPAGHAALVAATDDADDPPAWHVVDRLRQKARAERMSEGRRVALATILSIYNAHDAQHHLKGRGWTLRAGAIGRYLRDRVAHEPIVFDAYVHALAVYPGW